MTVNKISSTVSHAKRFASACAISAFAMGFAPQQANALTLVLDFTVLGVTENWSPGGSTLAAADFSTWGFTGMNLVQIQSSVLMSLNAAYLSYPTADLNPLSPLAAGQRLNISFELGTFGVAPSNGDTEYYYFGVGSSTGGEEELGHACYGCVRSAGQGAATAPNFSMVGVNFTDNLQGLTSLATTDSERINILAGTIAHEFGHALQLDHPATGAPYSFPNTNPGASPYSIMGTGADPTNMPNEERLKVRAFSYAEFSTLIDTVGVTAVPEPSTWLLSLAGLAMVAGVSRRRFAAAGLRTV